MKCESSVSFGAENTDVTERTQQPHQRELLLRKQLAGLTGVEAERERARLLYQEAHGEAHSHNVLQRITATVPKPKKAPSAKQSQLRLDRNRMRSKFDEFLEGDQNVEEMHRLVQEVAKMKAKTKKARDRSIIPFMSARKAVKTWKDVVAQHKAANATKQAAEPGGG